MSINLERYLSARGVIEAETAVRISHGVALHLAELHSRGLVYIQLVPRNVWLNDDISASLVDTRSEEYHAPELRPPADIYALGILMYEMLTGYPNFDGSTPPSQAPRNPRSTPEIDRTIPPDLDALILRCLEKEPGKRYQGGLEVARALEVLQ